MNQDVRIVIKPSVARKLLRMGYKIIDVRPQRQLDGSVDYTRCVFVFEYQDDIDKYIKQFTFM